MPEAWEGGRSWEEAAAFPFLDLGQSPRNIRTGYSGARLDRPGLNRLWDGVQSNAFDAILVLSPERRSRKCANLIRVLEEFERFATPVVFVERLCFDKTSGDDETDASPPTLNPLPPAAGVLA